MYSRLIKALVLAALTLPSALLATQPAGIAGSWALQAPETETNDDAGNRTVLTAITGTLTLDQKADVVSGSWKGRMPKPWTLTGHVDGKTFELETETRDMPI